MSEFKFACPICHQHIRSDSSASGTQIECPTCFRKIVVPQPPADEASGLVLSAAHAPGKRPVGGLQERAGAESRPARGNRSVLIAGELIVLAAALVVAGWFIFFRNRSERPVAAPDAGGPKAPVPAAAPDPRWRLDLVAVAIPTNPASGRILGREFALERATIQMGTLSLRQGRGWPPDVGVTIVLPKRPPSDYAGKEFVIVTNFPGRAPRVVLRAKDERQQPVTEQVLAGYAMKLEFGKISQGRLPGRIYLCTPDAASSVVVGSFQAEIRPPTSPKSSARAGTSTSGEDRSPAR